ncbi:MAG: glycosyltransferase family 2 protein [Ginsengibacter sp.]
MQQKITVIIPAYNEEKSIDKVILELPVNWVTQIIVVDNNSTDQTSAVAKNAGAIVLKETFQGYGSACLMGIDYLKRQDSKPDIVVFIDGDYSDYPAQLPRLIHPILTEDFEMVIGTRMKGNVEKGALTVQQVIGNKIASFLLNKLYRVKYSDLGPFRAIKYDSLISLNMIDKTYGWTVEMQIKAAKLKMKTCEVAVDYKKRIGFSKISGTISGTVKAGFKIIYTILKYL